MKRRYLSIIALALVLGIATVFTSCKSDEEAQADADKAAKEIENLFNDALNEVDSAATAVVDSAATVVDSVATDAVEEVKDATEEVTK